MFLAGWGIIPPAEWYHDPTLDDIYEKTVAVYLVCAGIDPPKEWLTE